MLDKSSDEIIISGMNGWIFRLGNDSGWNRKDINISGWRKLKPEDLSARFADNNGRTECWFRVKIKLDSSIKEPLIGFKINTWAATDLYINGNHLYSFGSTGTNGVPFKEFNSKGRLPVPIDLKMGSEYTIALHIVDFLTPLPPRRLKSEMAGFSNLIRLTGPSYNNEFMTAVKQLGVFTTIWISVCTVLSLLFWLLYIQNANERGLRLIALGTTFTTLVIFFKTIEDNVGISSRVFWFYEYVIGIFFPLSGITTVLILINIFNRTITRGQKIILAIYLIGSIVSIFLPVGIGRLVGTWLPALLLAVCIYYIASSWKKLNGAQWTIVVGLLFSLACGLLYIFMDVLFDFQNNTVFLLSVTGYSLSLPLSLLIYVSIRFREILKEVQQNAKQVVQLSAEKEKQALNQQKILQDEVNAQTAELRTTLNNLKVTQSQLIQSEKLASLGELTAGIAHEIQNPLNFVNNFSEVNKELLDEMKEEIQKGNYDEVKTIAGNIADNEDKISQHGKRADAIVKGMLQHSRASSGQKEPADINAIADEYLHLAYHGFRAKDKLFNATLVTDFDPTIGKINIVPQDMGRVLLNLYNNAFYAVSERNKLKPAGPAAGSLIQSERDVYEPRVTVNTKKYDGKVEIRVKDNGNGIPQKLYEKIFQPFFTTKPSGQGTGLGLSLSYDIVKSHGGEISVDTKEGEFAEFKVQIPAV